MVASVGYVKLFESEYCRFEISVGKKCLRKTVWTRNIQQGGLDKKEELFIWVADKEERERVKDADIWVPYEKGAYVGNVKIYEQQKSRCPTGYYKVVEIVRKADGARKYYAIYKENGGKI